MNSKNPFEDVDPDRSAIWDMLMRHDFEAFVTGDWSMVAADFWEEAFSAVDARHNANPDGWRITFPELSVYKAEWLRQVEEFAPVKLQDTSVLDFLYDSCRLDEIEIVAHRALAHKKFKGTAKTESGNSIDLRFQTIYQMVKRQNRWLICGFIGYLPNPMGSESTSEPLAVPW